MIDDDWGEDGDQDDGELGDEFEPYEIPEFNPREDLPDDWTDDPAPEGFESWEDFYDAHADWDQFDWLDFLYDYFDVPDSDDKGAGYGDEISIG